MSGIDLGRLYEVRLLNFPLALYLQAQEHADELVRELTHIANSQARGSTQSELPERLLALVAELTHQYGGLTDDADAARDAAIDRGESHTDLVYLVPAMAAQASRHLGEVFDDADGYCLAGEHLLTLATPHEALAFRHWYLDQFIGQIAGDEPTPWSDELCRCETSPMSERRRR